MTGRDSDANAIVDVDVVVVEPDLLWRVEQANELRQLNTASTSTLLEAAKVLNPHTASVVVIGPHALDDALEHLPTFRAAYPAVRLLAVLDELDQAALSALRAGIHEVELSDSGPSAIAERATELLEQARALGGGETSSASASPTSKPVLVVVTGAKAGEGATTVALAMALAATSTGAGASHGMHSDLSGRSSIGRVRCVLLEGDPGLGDVALRLGMHPAETEVLGTELPNLRQLIHRHPSTGLPVLLPPRPLDPLTPLSADTLADLLDALADWTDLIVADVPIGLVSEAGLVSTADHLLLVSRTPLTSIKNAKVIADLFAHAPTMQLVLNRFAEGPHGTVPDPQDISHAVGLPIVAEIPHDPELALRPTDGSHALREAMERLSTLCSRRQ
jgi:Flp pilus assembly CpaE family ATPase